MAPLYLRLSVTEGCNLRCRYCRPGDGGSALPPPIGDRRLLELVRCLHRAAPLGKLRITGGEPLCRPGIAELIGALRADLEGVGPIGLTTNGTLLARHAASLVDAGVELLNVSVDTCDPERFAALTGGGGLDRVLEGLRALEPLRGAGGLARVKLNAVLMRSVNGDAESLARLVGLAESLPIDEVRFIELMPIGVARALFDREHVTGAEALALLERRLERLGPLARRGTAARHRFRLPRSGREIDVGLITPVSEPFCSGCDRLRLDPAGRLYDCLRREDGVDLAGPAGRGQWPEVERRIRQVVARKRHTGAECWPRRAMVAIGG